MERSRSTSLKLLFCLPLKSEVIEEDTAPATMSASHDSHNDDESVVEPIQQVKSVRNYLLNYYNCCFLFAERPAVVTVNCIFSAASIYSL